MIRLLLTSLFSIIVFAFSGPVIAYEQVYDDDDTYYQSADNYDNHSYRSTNYKKPMKVKSATYRSSASGKNYQSGSNVFIFDPRRHTWAAYSNGRMVKHGTASGGKSYCPDIGRGCKTIVGSFRVISKGGPGCKSSRFPVETRGGAPMPYCMHFHKSGYAVHGSNEVAKANLSHGCVRVTPSDAHWLSHNFMKIGTPVIVRPY